MPLSIWEYLRQRARDAVLAGMEDALNIAEQGDTGGGQFQAARELGTRLADPPGALSAEANGHHHPGGPQPSANGHAAGPVPGPGPAQAPERPSGPPASEDDFQTRLDAAAPQADAETLPPGRITTRKKRGRPRKNSTPPEDDA
jgi:hypothetical protein